MKLFAEKNLDVNNGNIPSVKEQTVRRATAAEGKKVKQISKQSLTQTEETSNYILIAGLLMKTILILFIPNKQNKNKKENK